MSEAAQLAKIAREHLAAALKALQSNVQVPAELLEAAEPIAEAMSILHRVERTDGANLDGRDQALAYVRAALDRIQQVPTHHPAIEVVMENVASSLSKVHALTRHVPPLEAPQVRVAPPAYAAPEAAPRATPQPIAAPRAAPQVPIAAAPQPVMTQAVLQPLPAGPQAGSAHAPNGPKGTLIQGPANTFGSVTQPLAQAQPTPYAQPPAPPAYAQPPAPVHYAQQPAPVQYAQHPAPPQQPAPVHYAQHPAPPQQPAPVHYAQHPAPAQYAQQPAAPQQPAPPQHAQAPRSPATAPAPEARRPAGPASPAAGCIDVELGIHSTSNFYKGLGGNDVIEHGGIFVATYKVPKMGATVSLRVLLPGDYEFNAVAVVQWTRAAGDTSEPGFGARFTQIAPEGRQLVYRYTRNREPMFYDDL